MVLSDELMVALVLQHTHFYICILSQKGVSWCREILLHLSSESMAQTALCRKSTARIITVKLCEAIRYLGTRCLGSQTSETSGQIICPNIPKSSRSHISKPMFPRQGLQSLPLFPKASLTTAGAILELFVQGLPKPSSQDTCGLACRPAPSTGAQSSIHSSDDGRWHPTPYMCLSRPHITSSEHYLGVLLFHFRTGGYDHTRKLKISLTVPYRKGQLALNGPLLLMSHTLQNCRKWTKGKKERFRKILTDWRKGLVVPHGLQKR